MKSFGNKLLVKILATTIIVFIIAIFFISKLSIESSQENAEKFVKQKAQSVALNFKEKINSSISVIDTFYSDFQSAINEKHKFDENQTITKIKSILEKDENLFGLWWSIKGDSPLFNKESDKGIPKNLYTSNHNFSPYIVKINGKTIITKATDYNGNNVWLKEVENLGKTYITNPYYYDINGKQILMITISIPLYNDGKYIGALGGEIILDSLSKIAAATKIYEHGYAFVINQDGIIIGHQDKKYVSKNLLDTVNNDPDYEKAVENVKEGKAYSFTTKSKKGLMSYYYSKPFSLKNIDYNWSVFVNAPEEEYLASANYIKNFAIIISLIGIILIAIVILFSVRELKRKLSTISIGLDSFFKYLNKESKETDNIDLIANDEFGQMASNINNNIDKIKKTIKEENILIEDVKQTVNKVSEGYLNRRIEKVSSTDSLNELKDLFNAMLNNLQKLVGVNINSISEMLGNYSKRDFTQTLDPSNSGIIGKELIQLNNMMTQLLQDSQKDGLDLKESANALTKNVNNLNNNANEQAASLEETAASIDEITGNIKQTSEKSQEMLNISNETKSSAQEGKKLADDTVNAMEEINSTVNNINEAISVIDKIAFQTNILSLNAAVEAATAGESGKGFAVVAQEVRNLANRSAEAAKEIKDLVENATTKANNGKVASNKMIEGFTSLEEKIEITNNLIDDVSNAAKEQTIGMTQISEAVNQLDKVTQGNAAVADKTNSIAIETNNIAIQIVQNVHKNEFRGKNASSSKKDKFIKEKPAEEIIQKPKNNIMVEQKDDNEWESF